MAQRFFKDNVPSLVRASSTSLTLAAASGGQATRLTIGGQQYALSSALTCNTGTSGANGLDTGSLGAIQLWYVYAIVNQSSFAPALIASQAIPSAGPSMPSGYGTAYLLVGAFYTNGSSQVGSTVTITGEASTEWMSYSPVINATGGGAAEGGSASKQVVFRRKGDTLEILYQFDNSGSAGTAGTGTYQIPLPSGLAMDTTKLNPSGALGYNVVGAATASLGAGTPGTGYVRANSTTALTLVLGTDSVAIVPHSSSGTWPLSNSSLRLSFKATMPISGWLPTLL